MILSVLRLRQDAGLANPELDHPLVSTPLGRLHDATPMYSDDVLAGVLARALPGMPDL